MAIPWIGRGTALGWGAPEATWGLIPSTARAKWAGVESATMVEQEERDMVPHLWQSDDGFEQDTYSTQRVSAGSTSMPMRYDLLGYLLDACVGAVGVTTGAGPSYDHKWQPSASADPVSLALEVIRGKSGESEVFVGSKVASWALSMAVGQPMMLEIEWLPGQSEAARGSAPTPSQPSTTLFVLHNHAGTLSYNGSTYEIRSFEFRVDNALTENRELGSLTTSEQSIDGMRTARMSVDFAARNSDFYTANRASTSSDAIVIFTRPTTTETLTIKGRRAQVEPINDGITGPGVIEATAEFRCRGDGSTAAYEIAISNTQANRFD